MQWMKVPNGVPHKLAGRLASQGPNVTTNCKAIPTPNCARGHVPPDSQADPGADFCAEPCADPDTNRSTYSLTDKPPNLTTDNLAA